jgi:hypothetical protein
MQKEQEHRNEKPVAQDKKEHRNEKPVAQEKKQDFIDFIVGLFIWIILLSFVFCLCTAILGAI